MFASSFRYAHFIAFPECYLLRLYALAKPHPDLNNQQTFFKFLQKNKRSKR